MKNRRIGLIDIGLDPTFDVSMNFVQGILQNINAGVIDDGGRASPTVDVDFIRSRHQGTVMSALTAPYAVLHVMSHAGHDDGEPYFLGEDGTEVSLVHLAEVLRDGGRGLQVGAVLADGCGTGTGVWKRAFRECIQGDVTYIGTRGNIGWYEATVFSSAFYSALLRNRGRGATQPEQALEAADRAARAYTVITAKNCPYVAETLTPSRRALKAFNG